MEAATCFFLPRDPLVSVTCPLFSKRSYDQALIAHIAKDPVPLLG